MLKPIMITYLSTSRYPTGTADLENCTALRELLNESEEQVLAVEQLYASFEAHAVSDTRGDISHIGLFSNNSDKTVFEIFNKIEMCLKGWGTNGQRAHLLKKHLSEEIKNKDR